MYYGELENREWGGALCDNTRKRLRRILRGLRRAHLKHITYEKAVFHVAKAMFFFQAFEYFLVLFCRNEAYEQPG